MNTHGFDVAFSWITPQWAAARKAEGYRIGIQNLWTGGFAGNDGIKAVAENNLRVMREAGIITAAYANATPPNWWDIDVQVSNIIANAGAEWDNIKVIAIDVEIPGATLGRATELANALSSLGKDTRILYSGKWFWDSMPNPLDPGWRLQFPLLWNAYYDNDPDVDFPAAPYGLWSVDALAMEQYVGTTDIDGVQVDLNSINFEQFMGMEDDMADPEVIRLLTSIDGRLAALNTSMDWTLRAIAGDTDDAEPGFQNMHNMLREQGVDIRKLVDALSGFSAITVTR